MCVAEILGMISIFTLAALLPDFIKEWQLTNTQAGWLSAISLGGYTLSVPLLVSLTDRVEPKRLYLVSTGLGAASALGFALLVQGFWTALIFRTLTGIALAGTYMPGLKAMSDHVEESQQPRAIAFYTASFGIGTALSFFLAGHVNAWLNCRRCGVRRCFSTGGKGPTCPCTTPVDSIHGTARFSTGAEESLLGCLHSLLRRPQLGALRSTLLDCGPACLHSRKTYSSESTKPHSNSYNNDTAGCLGQHRRK